MSYTRGFRVTLSRPVTKADYARVCDAVGATPEGISEGGLLFINAASGEYKSMRHGWEVRPHGRIRWPYIELDALTTWRDNAEVLLPAGAESHVFLKALYGAPEWTLDEVQAIAAAMREHWDARITHMPGEAPLSLPRHDRMREPRRPARAEAPPAAQA
jgi:hypothetical protein